MTPKNQNEPQLASGTVRRVVRRYRRAKTARVTGYNPWNDDAEPGDLMVDSRGRLFRLETPSSFYASSAGILYPREVRPPLSGLLAEIHDGEVWWSEPNPQISRDGGQEPT